MSYDNNSGAVAEGYDSKHSGAVAEQMLDDYVAGNLGGEGGAKVYELDYYNLGITVTPEEYSAIKDADRVFISGVLATKSVDDYGTIRLTATGGSVTLVEPISASESFVKLYVVEVYEALIVKKYDFDTLLPTKTSQLTNDSHFLTSSSLELLILIPTKTSQLTNDSGFITAADLPPSGGLPTEVIELSSEITLQEGKMLEIDLTTPVTGALALRNPTITDATQGLLSGIRFYCGESLPQLSFTGLFGIFGIWANGEFPQLEPNSVIEILAVRGAGGAMFLLTWGIYKA